MNEKKLNELDLNELIDFLNNANPEDIDLDALLDVKLLEKVSIDDVSPELISVLMNDDKMSTDNDRPYQLSAKTSRGAKILYNLLNGSNHEKIKDLLSMKEEAMKAGVAVAFNDNIIVIENSLESIKSQVAAISKGIMSEEARYKARFLDPMASKIEEITTDLVNNEIMQTQLDRLSLENEKLTKEVEKLTLTNEENTATMAEQKDTINELTKESRDLMKANKLMSEKIDGFNNNIEKELAEQKNSYEKELKTKDDEISGLNKTIESLELERTQLSRTEETLRAEIKELKSDKLETENKHKEEVLNLNIAKNNAEFNVTSITMQKEKLENENTSLNNSLEQYKTRQKELEDNVNELKINNSSLEVKVDELNSLIGSHNKNIEEKQTKINGLEQDLQNEIKLRQERELEITRLQMLLNDLENKLGKTNDKVDVEDVKDANSIDEQEDKTKNNKTRTKK